MTKDEAMKLALEALETLPAGSSYKTHNAASALRQALAQPEQEPFEMKWPDYNESAMGCGIEDRNITDRYEAMQYGWDEAISRVSECLPDVLFTAPPSKQEPDYGIDRGAWSDVPDATKWVDELRGDEDLDEPPNSTTDVVEPVAWMYVNKDGEVGDIGYGVGVFTRKDPDIKLLYEAPPRREWVGLTDEELSAIWGEFGLALMPVRKAIASDIEAKLKEKNRD